jgi:hypothetical protein
MFLEGAPSQPAISPDKQIHAMSLDTFMSASLTAGPVKRSPPFGGRELRYLPHTSGPRGRLAPGCALALPFAVTAAQPTVGLV